MITGKGKGTPLVSIAADTHHATPGCGAHLSFTGLEPWQCAGLHPALWTLDHTSSTTCRHLPGYYAGTKLHCLLTEAHGCEQLAHSRYGAATEAGVWV